MGIRKQKQGKYVNKIEKKREKKNEKNIVME